MSADYDYTDPATVDVDTVRGNINSAYRARGQRWTDKPSWPNVTVKALSDRIAEVERERDQARARADELRRWVDMPDPNLAPAALRPVGLPYRHPWEVEQ